MTKRKPSTLAALLADKPKRGRPRHKVSRDTVFVALSQEQKETIKAQAALLPKGFSRADVPDICINLLGNKLESLRRAVSDRGREIPEGVTDLDSLYLLWDLPLPNKTAEVKWTSIRVSPQQVVDLGRSRGALGAIFGVNRSQVFSLSLALLEQFLHENKGLSADKLTALIKQNTP